MIVGEPAPGELSITSDGVELLRYVRHSMDPPFECRKPYVRALRSRAGELVTDHRPADHPWHRGLQLAPADLSGTNLWGGNTFIEGNGYLPLAVVGSMRASGRGTAHGGSIAIIEHPVAWYSSDERLLAVERRRLRIGTDGDDAWTLRWTSGITAVAQDALRFGSPATNGLQGSGYGGLAWRGSAGFTGGRIVSPRGELAEEDALGDRSPWLAFAGRHGDGRRTTVLIEDIGTHPAFETRWFVRSTEYPALNPAWAFHCPFTLQPGASFEVDYVVSVIDGEPGAADLAQRAARHRMS